MRPAEEGLEHIKKSPTEFAELVLRAWRHLWVRLAANDALSFDALQRRSEHLVADPLHVGAEGLEPPSSSL